MEMRNRGGESALHVACRNDQAEVVRALLDHGADVNARNGNGWTALHYSYRNETIASMLIDYGACVYEKDRFDSTALHFACYEDGIDDVVPVLIAGGSDVHSINRINDTPVKLAKRYWYGCMLVLSVHMLAMASEDSL